MSTDLIAARARLRTALDPITRIPGRQPSPLTQENLQILLDCLKEMAELSGERDQATLEDYETELLIYANLPASIADTRREEIGLAFDRLHRKVVIISNRKDQRELTVSARNDLFLLWNERDSLGPAAIRDKWNREHPDKSIASKENGRETVIKGIKSAKERREKQQ